MGDLQEALPSIMELVTTWGIKVLGALAVLIIGRIIAGLMRGMVVKGMQRAGTDATLTPFVSSMVYYLVLSLVVIAVLGLFGVPTAQFVAILGAAGLAVGLALQGTLSNFAAGVMLLVFRPFRVGDFVEVGGSAGSVVAIRVFSTTMNTGDNVRIVVPNSSVWGSVIKNYSVNDTRRNDMVVGVSYDDDLGKVMEIINGVLAADSRVLQDPEPLVAVDEMANSSMNLVVRPWCKRDDYWGLRRDLTRKLKEELEAAGCSIPFPQQDVHMHQVAAA
jgi:small conductance mechanosensitive channel